MARPFSRWIIITTVLICTLYYTGFSSLPFSTTPQPPTNDISYLKALLSEHNISPDITYASRILRYAFSAPARHSITKLDAPLFPTNFSKLNLETEISLPAPKRVSGPIPVYKSSLRPQDIDASDLLFGVSTTYSRFSDAKGPIKEWRRWLTNSNGEPNGASLILILHLASDAELESAQSILYSAGIDAIVQSSDPTLDMPGRYVKLVDYMFAHPKSASKKYFGLIDDDTFFPSLPALLKRLGRYDPKGEYYIGAFTERVDWIMDHKVPMAYGGGGVFLTRPLLQRIGTLPCLEKTEDGTYREWGEQGDLLLYNCLHNHTEIVLSWEKGLHQNDQWGDPSGFYESGLEILSVHHYKSWHHFAPEIMHVASDACGESCLLQRFQFSDNWILNNGYSLVEYPQGIDFDTEKMEGTFDNKYGKDGTEDVSLSFSFGPLRRSLSGTGRKKSWELIGARSEGHGVVRQVYLKRKADERWYAPEEKRDERDSVVVILWTE
ncbi:hypothetical protein B7494_g5191 [Chlorociboria aeruginascens]|nr:hypothetical protein B7494_g5191 [Chlorociboria aeruginascens]